MSPRLSAVDRHFRQLERFVVVVTTGRSGSLFMANLVNDNALNATAEHEPDVVSGDDAARWYYDGDDRRLDELARMKLRRVRNGDRLARLPGGEALLRNLVDRHGYGRLRQRLPRVPIREVYVEVNNGFAKSFGPALLRLLPEIELIHLTREPMAVAKSAANRGSHPDPRRPYYLWPTWDRNELPLRESDVVGLTPFQLALWYWFEMEARFASMRERLGLDAVYRVDLEHLSAEEEVRRLFDAHGISYGSISTRADRHAGSKANLVGPTELEAARHLVQLLPRWVWDALPDTYGLRSV